MLMIDSRDLHFRSALTGFQKASQEMEAAIDASANAYVLQCREERKQLRMRLTVGLNRDEKKFSQIILTYRLHNGYVDLYWAQIYRRPGVAQPRYKRISNASGTAHISQIVRGAINEDEASLIRTHEFGARTYRKLWSEFLRSRSATKTVLATAGKLLDDPSSARAAGSQPIL